MKNKGAVSILIVVLVISVLLLISIGLSSLIIRQIKMSSQAGKSVVSFYAAEAGAEECLYQVWRETGEGCDVDNGGSGTLDKVLDSFLGISFKANYDGIGKIISIGYYSETARSLELTW